MILSEEIDKSILDKIAEIQKAQVYSYSRLSLFESCPQRWFLKYVEGEDEGEAMPLMLGKAVHRAIEAKLRGKTDKDALLEGLEEIRYYPIDLAEYQKLFHNAPVACGEAANGRSEVELHFVLPLDDEGIYKIQGYLDLVESVYGSIQLTDWKTNRLLYRPDENKQLALYAWALSKTHGADSVRGMLYFLRFYKQARRVQLYEKEQMEQARLWALTVAKTIDQALSSYAEGDTALGESFPPTENPGCANCPFALLCYSRYPNITKGVFTT